MDALGAMTQTQYDAAGNVMAVTAYAKEANTFALPPVLTLEGMRGLVVPKADADRTTRYGHDAAGRMVSSVDATGAVKANQYDAAGRLKVSIRYAQLAAGITA